MTAVVWVLVGVAIGASGAACCVPHRVRYQLHRAALCLVAWTAATAATTLIVTDIVTR